MTLLPTIEDGKALPVELDTDSEALSLQHFIHTRNHAGGQKYRANRTKRTVYISKATPLT